ncbi:glycogen phosphorylase [Gammaproteobacteria bacterium]
MNSHDFLFEVSWEVCNKVGGIYTVLQSKLKQVIKNFGNNYILIGPWHEQNKGFVESSSPFLDDIKKKLVAKNILCHVGYWDTEAKPTVVLVEFKQRYKIDALLYNLWADFGVDSLGSNYDYQEPILFSTAAGEVICALAEEMLIQERQIVAHFHEWMCGAGLLYLKKHANTIATVFTTHATVLGRAMSQDNKTIYNLPSTFDPAVQARKHEVFAKHSLEKATAREADCFTVVSDVAADEARVMLGKYPDKIVLNGLDIEQKSKEIVSAKRPEVRAKLLQVASLVIGRPIDANALLWVTSGRYEFHNKGFDVLLKSLAQLENGLAENAPPIVVFFLIAANWHSEQDSLLMANLTKYQGQLDALGIATHRIDNPASDSIIKLCHELDLKKPEHKIHVVFSDAYLQGDDGVFDITYEQILAACDLSIFPSFYEPWGYTPLESIASSTPTITTDLSGFGCFINNLKQDHVDAVFVLKRKDYDEQKVIVYLGEYLQTVVGRSHDQAYSANVRTKALQVANFADWKLFYQDYLDAYVWAIKFNKLAGAIFDVTGLDNVCVTSIHEAEATKPRFHLFQYECILPEKIKELRVLAYNFWWSWHEEAKTLFQKIDPVLWEQVRHNPVYFLNLVSSHALQTAADNEDYIWLYNKVIADFTGYMQTNHGVVKLCNATSVSVANPIAYFCMEYGIAECLPIYSGGLGILAGDYLKAMSDLSVPTIAVGLFYKQGYFRQLINAKGEQEALYETWDPNQIPMRKVNDASGKAVLVGVEILGRTVYMQVWEVIVGRASLYLLDTDVVENVATDREITNSLYGGSREVRLMQELVLGIGGTRLLVDKLDIKPALYHLNEGHSAFLLLERIRGLCHQGYIFDEACEIVRSSSIFTTHTPVAAGNETFAEDLIKKYLQDYAVSRLGITFDKLFNLARDVDPMVRVFSMTVLALRLTLSANAVSRLHGKVARVMWNAIWPGLLECEVPIDVATNGVHLATWLGGTMRLLYEDYLPSGWIKKQDEALVWEKVKSIDNGEVWKAHQIQKEKLLKVVRQLLVEQYTLRNESKQLINASLKCLTNNTLVIGLSRRFTAYKRNDLFLRDPQRLARVLNNEKEPVVVLMAGKAHPADDGGRDLIREIIETLRLDMFNGHIIFLEEYNIGLAKLLVQGVDVWLNTPILGREACGTSGMKAGINGGLNFSTKDGWWDEAYNDQVGWQIESLTIVDDIDKRDDVENMCLLETLETEIVPLYYKANRAGFNSGWVEKMKASIALVACNYNTSRMVRDYANNFYSPVVLRNEQLMQNNLEDLKKIVAWKQDITERFNTVKIKAIFVNGIQDGKITSGGLLKVKLLLFSGKMESSELKVEFVLIRTNSHRCNPVIISLQRIESREVGVLTYVAEYQIEDTGFYSYGVRVLPYNPMLFRQQDAGLVYWG